MIFGESDRPINGEFVLLCEDVLSTGGSISLTQEAITDCGAIALPAVLALVNRSGLWGIDGSKIFALVDRPIQSIDPKRCKLCYAGSEAIRPKEGKNWGRLNAIY